jgi:hypothetical protein
MSNDLLNTIDTTTKETNKGVKDLSNDVAFGWQNIKENRERIAVNANIIKDIPELLRKFYHLEKVVSKGNGSPSLMETVSILRDDNIAKTQQIKTLKENIAKVTEDTESNSTFRNRMIGISVVVSVIIPTIISAVFLIIDKVT